MSGAPTTITSIPLTDTHPHTGVGDLVKDATVQMSTLVRAEVALAKTELFGELKKALVGSVFFILSLTVLLLSSIYFFFFFAAFLHEVFDWAWWVSAGVCFLVMLLISILTAGIGVWRITKVRAPRKTITSVKQLADVVPSFSGTPHEDYQRSSFTAPIATGDTTSR